jgi:hypothetical protein
MSTKREREESKEEKFRKAGLIMGVARTGRRGIRTSKAEPKTGPGPGWPAEQAEG